MFGRKLVLIPMDKHTFKCEEDRAQDYILAYVNKDRGEDNSA